MGEETYTYTSQDNDSVFGGGNDTIFDYVFGNDVINAGVLDIDNGTYDETAGFVTITKDDNNSLSIKLGKTTAPKVTFTDGEDATIKNYTNIGFFNDDITAVTLKADVRITDDGSIGFIADKLVNDQGLTYSNISTIFADNVYDTMSTKPIIKGLAGVSTFIFGGSKVLKLIGGNLADTLVTFNGEDYSFRVTDNYQEIITGDKSGGTITADKRRYRFD